MTRKQIWLSGAAAVAVLSLAATALSATADSANPTRAEALAGVAAAKTYVQQHPGDAGEAAALSGADALTEYINAVVEPTPPPTTTPTTTVFPTSVTAVPSANKITLSWQPPTGGMPIGYKYGRNGVDNTGTGPWTSGTLATTLRSVVLDKLMNGTSYTVFVEAVYATSNKRVSLTVVAGVPTVPPTTVPPTTTSPPTTTVPPTTTAPPTTTPPVAGARLSGLNWDSGVWTNQNVIQAARFTSIVRGDLALDNYSVYTWRNTQASQNQPVEWRKSLPADFDQTKQNLVLGLTTWTSDGAFMTAAQAAAIGTSMCTIDTTGIVRLDWEMNLADGAGQNGAVLTAANYASWVARFRAVATALKTSCPGVKIDFNPNHGLDQTSGCNSGTYASPNNCSRRAFQAVKDLVDIFGIDRYDAWPVVTASGSGWNGHLNGFNELDESRLYALANGKKWSVPEWGLWTGGAGGGDDPKYIQNYFAYFNSHSGDIAYENYFNEPASYIISDLLDHNPNSRAAYRAAILAS